MTEKAQTSTPKPGTLWLSGRIRFTQQVGTDKDDFPIIETIVVTPAADPYSHPNRYCIMSRSKIGKKDEDLVTDRPNGAGDDRVNGARRTW